MNDKRKKVTTQMEYNKVRFDKRKKDKNKFQLGQNDALVHDYIDKIKNRKI